MIWSFRLVSSSDVEDCFFDALFICLIPIWFAINSSVINLFFAGDSLSISSSSFFGL